MIPAVLAVSSPAAAQPPDDAVGPGVGGFIAIFILALATVLLIRSMVGHLRKVRYGPGPQDDDERDGTAAPPASAERGDVQRAAAERAAAERAPADRGAADRAPADRAPADPAPADRTPAERTAADRGAADRAAADRGPADRTPADRRNGATPHPGEGAPGRTDA